MYELELNELRTSLLGNFGELFVFFVASFELERGRRRMIKL